MNPQLQALAERRRTNRLRRPYHPQPPAPLPTSFLDTIWPPPHQTTFTSTLQTAWNTGRALAAHCWPTHIDRQTHPYAWRVTRILWTLAGLAIYIAATAAGLVVLLTRPFVWAVANAVGYSLVSAGWSPPLSEADVQRHADPEHALFDDDHEHTTPHYLNPPTSSPAHPATDQRSSGRIAIDAEERSWQAESETAARHERQTAALEALAQQPTPHHNTETTWPLYAPTRPPVSIRRWVIRALIGLSLISATGLLITAWTLAALSASGTIPEPPTNDELIDHIHTRTEQRANDLADPSTEEWNTP